MVLVKKLPNLLIILTLTIFISGCWGETEKVREEIEKTEYYKSFNVTEYQIKKLSCIEYKYNYDYKNTDKNNVYEIIVNKSLLFNGEHIEDKYTLLLDTGKHAKLENAFVERANESINLFSTESIFIDVGNNEVYSRLNSVETIDTELRNHNFDRADWNWAFSEIISCYNYEIIPEITCSELTLEEFSERIRGNHLIRDQNCIDKLKSNETFRERIKSWNWTEEEEEIILDPEDEKFKCKTSNDCKTDEFCSLLGKCEKLECSEDEELQAHQCVVISGQCRSDSDCIEFEYCDSYSKTCNDRTDNCISLYEHSGKTADIVFIGTEFSRTNNLIEYVRALLDYNGDNGYNGLFSVEPLKTNREKFNVYVLNAPKTHKLTKYVNQHNEFDKSEFSLDSRDMSKKLCKSHRINTTITLIKNTKENYYHMNSSYCYFRGDCLVLIGDGTESVNGIQADDGRELIHEFGHGFAQLADEYVPFNVTEQWNQISEEGVDFANCVLTIEEAQEKWGSLADRYPSIGYYNGCAYVNNNIRPTANSIMRYHWIIEDDFFEVNERRLKEAISSIK